MNSLDDMFLASTIGDLIWLKSCIEQDGLNPLTLRNKHGYTCLHLSALNARPKCVEFLLGRGLSPGDLTHQNNNNAFHLAVERKNGSRGVLTLKILLSSLFHIPANTFLDQQNTIGKTPLHIAMGLGCISYIKLLLKANPQTDIRDEDGNLPIDVSKIEGHYEAMRLLQAHQWSLDKNRKEHFMLVCKNKELLDNQHKSRVNLEVKQQQSKAAYNAWTEKKSLPLLQDNRLYPDSGPMNKPNSLTNSPVIMRVNKDISLNHEQKKHNLTIYKHTQPLPAPLVIRATSALKRHKLWLPEVATKSAPSTRHQRRDSLQLNSFYAFRPATQGRMSVSLPHPSDRNRHKVCKTSLDGSTVSICNIPSRTKTADPAKNIVKTKFTNEKDRELILSKLPVKVPIRIQNFIFPETQPDHCYEDFNSV
ncbi:Ankyrin repeat and KH domain-containing protein mask-like [Oopsacas minuta]|uniref:Ankyrin repeat and KH domain-containing protein mask-like n=1 Tax=Oopsacas minuta TaxID=111878 RepID=A0AAV7JXE9_9METZ|nr:Ankyrin repeat and KH domain-containing protein mask-like [Oopsacas minuta]